MAPSPVLDIEPKGPDKSGEKCTESVSTDDTQSNSKTIDDTASSEDKIPTDELSFAEIEEAGLKSLLDEAYSYKSPKDRLGKSNLFQVLLNEVEENDASKKTVSERSNSFVDGRGNASVSIGNGHDTANDKAFLNNLLGGCEKDKKKKKNKRESSGTNGGSRRPKFSHSMKVNPGPQSSSSHLYNGNTTNNNNNSSGSNISSTSNSSSSSSSSNNSNTINSSSSSSSSNVHYNSSGSRSLSRAHQPFATRINNSKTAALLTSSSNIDIPMVTTYNKQPIMTPALVPSSQKSAEHLILDLREQNSAKSDDMMISPKSSAANGAEKENDIEMKVLETKNNINSSSNDSVYNYTTHASLEIGGAGNTDACKQFNDCVKDNDNAATVIFPLQSSGRTAATTVMNGNAERSSTQHCNSQKPINGLLADEKEDMDNVVSNNDNNSAENDEDKHSKKKNKKKQVPCLENDSDNSNRTSIYATSVDEPKTMTSLLQKSAQNSSTNNSAYKYPTESSYSFTPWHVPAVVPNLIVTLSNESVANLGRNICTKDSFESRRLYDENGVLNSNYPYLNSNSASMNRDRLDNVSERKHKIRKPKKRNTTSVLSENIEGYCGHQSVEYLLDYIENTKTVGGSGGGSNGGNGGAGGGGSSGGNNGVIGENGGNVSGKSVKSKSSSSVSSRNNDRNGKNGSGKASTDDDVRNKKPNRAKERLKKSTSLEDLRHSSSRTKQQHQNKKQSSVDDSHYVSKDSSNSVLEVESASALSSVAANSTPVDYHTSSDDAAVSQRREYEQQHHHPHQYQQQQHPQQQQYTQHQHIHHELDHSPHVYYDNLDHVDDDNYTENEFHLVTKKQRKKKRRSKSRSSTLEHQKHHHSHHQQHGIHESAVSSLSPNFLPHNYTDKNDNGNFAAAYQNSKRSTRSTENRHRSRRKSVSSVVPSDKISDSDSIHSLPVSSTTPKCKIKKKSTSSGCTPQASYADIAKSPQCNSSTTLNGGDAAATTAKWHRSLKTFSSSPSSSLSSSSANSTQNTCGSVTTASSLCSSSASSSNTADSPEQSDISELVCANVSSPSDGSGGGGALLQSSNVVSDESCDLNCNKVSFCETSVANTSLTDDKDSGCSSVDNGGAASECTVDEATISTSTATATSTTTTPPRRKNKSSTSKNTIDNDSNNNGSNTVANVVCYNGGGISNKVANGVDSTKMPKDYHSNISNNSALSNNASNNNNLNHSNSNNNNNTISNSNNNVNYANITKVKKTRNRKNKNPTGSGGGSGNGVDEDNNVVNDNNHTANGATYASTTITTTKCSETQTDLETIEVNNNACSGYHHNPNNSNGCNDVSVEETIVLKCSNKNNESVSFDGCQSMTYVDRLSHSLPINNETGQSVMHVLNDRNCTNTVSLDENVDEKLSHGKTTVEAPKHRQLEIQKEIVERSSKYNVTEVIQYVNKSWNEIMNLASSQITNTSRKVQYYASK